MIDNVVSLFDRHQVEFNQRRDAWQVQGNWVLRHAALERLAAVLKIHFDVPRVIRNERDECVVLVIGDLNGRSAWSFGEAAVGQNYQVKGKMAAYPYAMAEKRAKDRVILKLVELAGVYAEWEAEDFAQAAPEEPKTMDLGPPTRGEQQWLEDDRGDKAQAAQLMESLTRIEAEVRQAIKVKKGANELADYMLTPRTKDLLKALPQDKREDLEEFARSRFREFKPKLQEAAA